MSKHSGISPSKSLLDRTLHEVNSLFMDVLSFFNKTFDKNGRMNVAERHTIQFVKQQKLTSFLKPACYRKSLVLCQLIDCFASLCIREI